MDVGSRKSHLKAHCGKWQRSTTHRANPRPIRNLLRVGLIQRVNKHGADGRFFAREHRFYEMAQPSCKLMRNEFFFHYLIIAQRMCDRVMCGIPPARSNRVIASHLVSDQQIQ